jgi:hypothetical protein
MSNLRSNSLISAIIVVTFLIGFSGCVAPGISDWQDSNPTPVQQTTAHKTDHNDMGARRIARVNRTIFCLADGVNDSPYHEGVYRSTDNGKHWSLIGDMNHATRGTILTGPGEMIYIFWMSVGPNPGIYMSKFHYSDSFQEAMPVYQGYVKSVGYGDGYETISAAVDLEGNIYLACHYGPSEGKQDRIWLLKSFDKGNTWTTPKIVAYEAGTSFTHPSLEVNHSGNLVISFAHHAPSFLGGKTDNDKRVYFMKSTDKGETWGPRVQIDNAQGPFGVYNPSIIEDQANILYIFAQRAGKGLVMAKSTDGGTSWSGFSVIVSTSDYADPSAAVASDGTLYVTFRKDLLCEDATPSIWRNSVIRSTDHGVSWTTVKSFCGQGQTGPANSLRYANFWNYGGPLEWCWQQYLKSNTNHRPVYYDINTDVSIWDRTSSAEQNR